MHPPHDSTSISETPVSQTGSEQSVGRIFFGWVLLLLACDLLTLRWFPVPWYDEVLFADPAASLLLHGHWTSTIWFGRGDFTYWSGNTPAYSALLIPWLWLWGVGEVAVRSLDCVLFAITLVCLWLAVKRLNLIPSPKIRAVTLIALSLCFPVAYCVRCGRPDVLGMLIFSLGAFFWAGPRRFTAFLGLFICAAIIPFVGLHYAFYMPVLLGVLLLAGGKPVLPRICAIVVGGIVGGILLLAYYQFAAGWDGLLANMSNVHERLPGGFLDRFLALLRKQILLYYFGRPHFVLLIVAAGLLAIVWKRLTAVSRRTWAWAVIMLLIPGLVIGQFAHFMAPYHWLAAAPAMILLASAMAKSWQNFGPKIRLFFGVLALGLAVSGRMIFLLMGWGTGTAGYVSQIEKDASALVQPGQIVYTDPQLYYAVKPRAGQIYFALILPVLTAQEKASISIAFLRTKGPDFGAEWFTNAVGGHWVHVSDLPEPCSQVKITPPFAAMLGFFHAGDYIGQPLSVYRRVDDGP